MYTTHLKRTAWEATNAEMISCRVRHTRTLCCPFSSAVLVPVVQRADNFIHWIVCYPADKMCARFSR